MSRLDQQRERIQEDLRGLIGGEVRCDDAFLQLYSADASIYEIKPLGVVLPRTAADVSALVQYAAQKKTAVHARGAGTGLAGESLGPGLVVDFSAHLRRIIRIDEDRARVQAGVVHQRLNEQLFKLGRVFGPDPATSGVSTIGSMIAVDAGGSRWLKYGSTRRHVKSLQVVLADGHVMELGREPLIDGASTSTIPRKRELVSSVAALLAKHAELICEKQPAGDLSYCGYTLAGALGEDYVDMASLLVGSEGTLALVTEADLSLDALPRHRGLAILLFESLEKAARAVMEVLPARVTVCDLMERRHLSLAREAEPRFEQVIPPETEAALLVEMDGDDLQEVRDRMNNLVAQIWQQRRLAFGARQAFEGDEPRLFWQLVERSRPALYRVKGPARPVPIVEDMTVSPAVLPDFLVRMQNVLKRNQVTASFFSHAGHGQIHIEPFLDLSNPDDVQRMRRLADELYEEVFAVGGGIGGQRACGLSRTAFVRRQTGPLFDVFLELKRIFDPQNILNPGKILGDDPDLIARHLHAPLPTLPTTAPAEKIASEAPAAEAASDGLRNLVEVQLNWDPRRVRDVVADCNRCGHCRTQTPELRMCPIFRFFPGEDASPRAKANLIRGVLCGTLSLNELTAEEFKTIADLCVHCHSCRFECPAGVDIPRLMRESKGAYTAANGLPMADWIMTRLDLVGAAGGMIAPAINWSLGNAQMRWLLEKTLGIAQGRKLPRVASRSFVRRAAKRKLTRPSRRTCNKVVYFTDVYANYFDPRLAEATVDVLEHNGVSVYVPADQRQAGMASIASGALEYARRLAHHNVTVLVEAVRQGYHVVATEPAAAMCLKHEYVQLLDDDDARLVAANTSEACHYLWNMHTRGALQLDFKPLALSVGYHAPCLLRALNIGSPGEQLLGLIPGLTVRRVEGGCSGMAGTFGLLHKNYRNSLRVGWKLISQLRDPGIHAGATECSACKIQMEQAAGKMTIHPIKLLAHAYGRMPELAKLFNTPEDESFIS